MSVPAALLSIAGYDPSSGAGVLLDAAVFRRFGYHGLGVITSVTVQNTMSVRASTLLRRPSVRAQYMALEEDIAIQGVKVGMLGGRENIAPVARILREQNRVPKVVDPVLRSSSGRWLIEKEAVSMLVRAFRDRISVMTPNLDEAGWLAAGRPVTPDSMKEAAKRIASAVAAPVVIKGGHLRNTAVNVLYDGAAFYLFEKPKIDRDVHGTGCFFSAALLALLASREPLIDAVRKATDITHQAIGEAVRLGNGRLVISPASLA